VDKRQRELDRLRKSAYSRAHEEVVELERRGEELRLVRERAQHANHCRGREVFVIDDTGVYSSVDMKPITDSHQTLADELYHDFLSWGMNPRGFLHDPEKGAFYLPDPPHKLVFSRDRLKLACFFWAFGDDHARPWDLFGPECLDPQRAQELGAG
jgi:hypothetical protein